VNFISLLKDRRGGVAPLLALTLIPLLGAVGAAVDYSRANSARTAMQAAVDATALLMVKNMTNAAGGASSEQASTYFYTNFTRKEVTIQQISANPSPTPGKNALTVSATGSVPTMLLKVLGYSVINLQVTSSAVSVFDGLGCVLALGKTASDTFTGQGTTSVALKGCSLYDNSSSTTAVTVGGSAKISTLSVGVVGGITPGSNGLTADLGIHTGMSPVDDPYKNVEPASFGACTVKNLHATTSQVIDPGVYCGGIDIHSGATITLNPGVYYLDGGDLTVNGNATLTGTGVTLVFSSKNNNSFATASINGNATVNLSPPNYGPTAGIVMFGDRNMPVGTTFKLEGGAAQNLAGAIYFPKGTISFSGGNATSTSCTQIIGNKVTFSGTSSLAINCSSYQTKPFGTWSIRLTS